MISLLICEILVRGFSVLNIDDILEAMSIYYPVQIFSPRFEKLIFMLPAFFARGYQRVALCFEFLPTFNCLRLLF